MAGSAVGGRPAAGEGPRRGWLEVCTAQQLAHLPPPHSTCRLPCPLPATDTPPPQARPPKSTTHLDGVLRHDDVIPVGVAQRVLRLVGHHLRHPVGVLWGRQGGRKPGRWQAEAGADQWPDPALHTSASRPHKLPAHTHHTQAASCRCCRHCCCRRCWCCHFCHCRCRSCCRLIIAPRTHTATRSPR